MTTNHNKGHIMSMFTYVLLFALVIFTISVVLIESKPIIESATTSVDIKNAENIMRMLDDAVREVTSEGANSSRILTFSAPKRFESISGESSIEFETSVDSKSGADYFSRQVRNNLVYISGNDVYCSEKDANSDGVKDLVVENSFLSAAFKKVAKATPLSALDTSSNIIQLVEKTGNTTVTFVNTSIAIDNDANTSVGTGFSEILKIGSSLPSCTVHFYVNSTVRYDVYYKLYAGADFIVAEVRNII